MTACMTSNRSNSEPPSPVIKLNNPLLRTACAKVEEFESAKVIVDKLRSTLERIHLLYDFKRGSGIAAPQIGILSRISVICWQGVWYDLINPEIIACSKEKIPMREGCLSYFDFRGDVMRHKSVTVRAADLQGNPFEISGEGDLSSLLQHELDHLDGMLYVDRLTNGEKDLYLPGNMPKIP